MNKPPSLLSLLAFLAVLAIFGVVGAKYMLNSHSEKTMQQLGVVWPDIAAMPEQERAFLTELALTCNVADRPAAHAEVVACLRSATAKMQPSSTVRLARLIEGAPPAQQQR